MPLVFGLHREYVDSLSLSLLKDNNVLCNLFGKENNVLSRFCAVSGAKKLHEDNIRSFGSGEQDGAHTWSAVSKEAEALVHLNENASCSSSHSAYSKAHKSHKGVSACVCVCFFFFLCPFIYDCLTVDTNVCRIHVYALHVYLHIEVSCMGALFC